MNNIFHIFEPQNYPHFPPRRGAKYLFKSPGMVRVRGNVQGDTFVLNSSTSLWELRYGGINYVIDWNHQDLLGVDDSFICLWRHHLTDEVQVKAPPTISSKFKTLCHIAREVTPDICLVSLLAVFSRLYRDDRPKDIYQLRAFYAWGVSRGIEIFDRGILNILNDLPAPKRNPYESIFLQQNYVTPDQEVQLLRYIDTRLSSIESTPNNKFSSNSYFWLRDVTLLMLVYETAPRPLQVHMIERKDIKEIEIEHDSYYSIRFRRNKNRHYSEEYTSPREISVRLGNVLKKLTLLNQTLFNQQDEKGAPLFLDAEGNRLPTNVISGVVAEALECVFGVERLAVKGATNPFRHHLGQSLADQGAPPAVIADRLGHTTEVAARAYITATPNIAKIKTRALGGNETYRYLMTALMTGSIMRRDDIDDEACVVRGTVGAHYIVGIGACDVKGSCHSNPVYACYTCRKFHPFVDGPHDQVVEALQEQVVTFIEGTADLQHSRPITQLEIVIESAKAVAEECKKYGS